jgi:CRP/FNR family transcriptional regulator, cyclic AMP receptor protein
VSVSETIGLLEIEPDLGRYMNAADREAVGGLHVPVVTLPVGDLDVKSVLSGEQAFAAVLIDGLLVRRIVVGESGTLRLLGPGDVIATHGGLTSSLVTSTGWRAAAPTQVAVLGRDVLVAAHHAPRLVAGLQGRIAEQTDRVAVQLAICQLPRVEDRVLSILWLLAESWGQVTPLGTALRLRVTHETLGGLVGARRSTVTLALGRLAEEGAIVREEGGWILRKLPPAFADPRVARVPELLARLETVPE